MLGGMVYHLATTYIGLSLSYNIYRIFKMYMYDNI